MFNLEIEADPLVLSDKLAYNGTSEAADEKPSSWFISKNTIISGFGLFGTMQGEGEQPSPKVRRKRVIRKKVTGSSG